MSQIMETENEYPEPGSTVATWICPKCWLSVPVGQLHICPYKSEIDERKIDRIIELLERIDATLEHLDHNIGAIEYNTRRLAAR